MQKRIFVLLTVLFLGVCFMPNDLPDWNLGFDPIEAGRRIAAGIIGSDTGRVIWSHNFEDGISEFDIEALSTGTAVQYGGKAYSGGSCLRMLTAAVTNDYVSVEKFISLPERSKFGVEFYLLGEWPTGNGGQQLQVKIYHKLSAGAGDYLNGSVYFRRSTAGVETFKIWTGGAWVDPGLSLPPVFRETGAAPTDTIWHRIKIVGDYSGDAPHYEYIEVDNVRYDLSAYTIPLTTTANVMPWYYLSFLHYTLENSVNGIYIDRLVITDREP